MSNIYLQKIPATVQKGRGILLKVEGELVIQHAEEVRKQLTEILQDCKSVRVVLQNVDSLDLTFIQLLYAAQKTARALQKRFTLEAQFPQEVQQILKNSGFESFLVDATQTS